MSNYANSIFAAQQMQMQCANDILEAHRKYENSLIREQQNNQQDSIYTEYNLLVDEFNELLRHSRSLAASLKEAREGIDNAKTYFDQVDGLVHSLNEEVEAKNNTIQNLSNRLNEKNIQADKQQSDFLVKEDQMRETIFNLTLVNTVLSTQALAVKHIVNEWQDGKVYQKHNFLKSMQEQTKLLDFNKNKSGSTNSTEAITYLKLNNHPVFLKVLELI